MADDTAQNESAGPVDLSGLGSFDFAPSWTQGEKVVARRPREDRDGERRAFPPRGGEGSRRDDRRGGEGAPRREGGFKRDDRREGGFKRDDRRDGSSAKGPRSFARPERREFVNPLAAEIRVLPAPKDLGGIIRKIQSSRTAYPLKQLAYLFLDNPASCLLKITPADPALCFHVCKACGFATFSEEDLDAHAVAEHLVDYFAAEEIECEPPKGTFTCVAKCGLSGELLGPPNHHGFAAKVKEMLRTRYPHMNEADYRARVEMVRDPETVEQWRTSCTKRTVYRLKQAGGAAADGEEPAPNPALDREQAEGEFRRLMLPAMKDVQKTVSMPADVALKTTDRALLFACRDALAGERRFPKSLVFSLRGAFHHRNLNFFRANDPRGPEFVCAAKPAPLDRDHAIPELVEIVKFVEEHSPCSVAQLSAEQRHQLEWLVEKGHLVRYFNGMLALPGAHPKFRGGQPRAAADPEVNGKRAAASAQPAEAETKPAEAEARPAEVETKPVEGDAHPAADAPMAGEVDSEKKEEV